MYVQTGKTFIATLIALVLSLGGMAWLSSGGHKGEPTAIAQTNEAAQTPARQTDAGAAEQSANAGATATSQTYEEGYRTGYRDGHQDCATTQTEYVPSRGYNTSRYSQPRVRVAGERYYAEPRRTHSKRNMFLTIAGPAAIGAGIGAIARGGKGAGIGALLGGGGGALYYLVKHRHD
jgi:hypothetical protein